MSQPSVPVRVGHSGGVRRGIAGAVRLAALLVALLTVAACTGTPDRGGATAATSSGGNAGPVEAGVAWQLTHPGPEHAIEGYADHVSAHPGDRVRLFVSTTAPRFTVTAFRIGNYPPTGGARVWTSTAQPGHVQPAAQV